MKHRYFATSLLLFFSFSVVGCGTNPSNEEEITSKTVEERRLNALSSMDNYTWNYYTEIRTDSDLEYNRTKYNLHTKSVYTGEGRITSTNAMTIEDRYDLYTYPIEYVRSISEEKELTIEQYTQEYMMTGNSSYQIDNQYVSIKKERLALRKSFVILNLLNNKYFAALIAAYPDANSIVREPEYLSDSDLELSIKNFIPLNIPLFKEVVKEKNKENDNSYKVTNPTPPFYYADSLYSMYDHKMDSIKFIFSGDKLQTIDYVYNGRGVTVSISKIGSTTLETYPGTLPSQN